MTIFPYSLANLKTIYVILSCFYGIYILLSMIFYQLHDNINQGNILTIIPQLTAAALMHLIRFTIIVTMIGLILSLVYSINNGIKLINSKCTDDNCKIFGNISRETFNYTISMDTILWVIICKFLYSYIMFYVNYDKLNGIIIMTIITIYTFNLCITKHNYSSIGKFKRSDIVQIYILQCIM